MVGALLSGAALVSTGAQAQTTTTADPAQTSTGAQVQTAKTAGPAPVSTGVPMTMATIADPTPAPTGAQAQTTTTAKAKPKHKKPKPDAKAAIADPPAVSTEVPITLGPPARPSPVLGAQAQGCCEGGSATGANARTTGNATAADWPADSTPPPANAAPLVIKATPVAEPVPYWWTHGEIEVGGRGFTNNPQNGAYATDILTSDAKPTTATASWLWLGQKSLGKYYEYSDIAPGLFGGGHVATGSNDGLYQVDLWANNVASNYAGFSDQSYLLSASKAGEQYFTAAWDQTPHVYSTNAQTPYNGLGTSALTLPPGFPTGAAPGAVTNTAGIIPFLHQVDIGIQRNTAAAGYRWTPTDAWDFSANYSHTDRTGTQAAGVVELNGFNGFQIPAPVNDTTQNYNANGEYAGISPWGQKFTVKLGYNGSTYTDHLDSYTVANPFFPNLASCALPTAAASGTANCLGAQMGTPPSNQANGFVSTIAADLPMQSRYVGTFNFTSMTQNSQFQPMTNNPNAVTSPFGPNWNQVNFGFINGNLGDPTSSLNGQIYTFLSNNVVTTKITPDLTNKLSYRYYDYQNDTPYIVFPCWISYDQTGRTIVPGDNPCGGTGVIGAAATGSEATIGNLNPSYIKQDAVEALNWRPSKEWNFNAEYTYERYDWSQTDVNATNENGGKLSADWNPTTWFTTRASGSYAERRYDNYNYQEYVVPIQFPALPPFTSQHQNGAAFEYSTAYQQFMFDNRDRTKLNFAVDIVALRGITVSPTFKYQDDYYGLNPLNQEGIDDQRSLSWGTDVAWVVNPDLSFVFTYYYENYNQLLYSQSGILAPGTVGQSLVLTNDKEHVNTITAAMNWSAIPDKLNIVLRYTMSDGLDNMVCWQCAPAPAFPADVTVFSRFDASAIYKFDPAWVHSAGWKGDLKAKLNYTWERNSVSNWQNDNLAFLTPQVSATAFWMAYDNPNYNVQMLAASLIASW